METVVAITMTNTAGPGRVRPPRRTAPEGVDAVSARIRKLDSYAPVTELERAPS